MRTGFWSGGSCERQPQLLAPLRLHAAEQQLHLLPGHAFLREQVLEPDLGVAVLGEHHDALVGPVLAVGQADRLEVGDQLLRLRVRAVLVPRRPGLHPLQEADLLLGGIGQFRLDFSRTSRGVILGVSQFLVVVGRDVVEEPFQPLRDLVLV